MFHFNTPACLPCAALRNLLAADTPSKHLAEGSKCARFEAKELKDHRPTLLASLRCRNRKCTPWAEASGVEQLGVRFESETLKDHVLPKRPVERKCTPWQKVPEATKLVRFALDSNPDHLQTYDEEIQCAHCPNSCDGSFKLDTEVLPEEFHGDELLLMTRQNDDGHLLQSDADISIDGLRCRERKATPWNPLERVDSDTESTTASVEEELPDAEAELTVPKFVSVGHAEVLKPESEDLAESSCHCHCLHRSQMESQQSPSVPYLFMCCAPSHTGTNEMQLSFGGFP